MEPHSQTPVQPLVSIILCTYNRMHLVGRAIDSVFRQTYGNWELIIIDDGSRDGSEEVLRAFARMDGRIRYARHANRGIAYSRNKGLLMAGGEFVTFLDSDDEYAPSHLLLHMRFLQRHPRLDAVHGRPKPVGPRGRQYVPDVDRPGRKIHVSRCHAAGTLLARRARLVQIRGFREMPFSEDYDLVRRLRSRFRVQVSPFRTYLYHVEADHRLCDLYAHDGVRGILRYRAARRRIRRAVTLSGPEPSFHS